MGDDPFLSEGRIQPATEKILVNKASRRASLAGFLLDPCQAAQMEPSDVELMIGQKVLPKKKLDDD